MKAILFHDYGGPEQLAMEDVPVPQPGPGAVLVRIHAAGVNPVDWKIRAGYMRQFRPIPLPAIPGRDLAGVIQAAGAGVAGYAPGQAVYGTGDTGTYAEYALAAPANIALMPGSLTFEQAASVPVGLITAWRSLFDAGQFQPGQRVLVQGAAGGVGLFVVQLAAWKAGHVIGTASSGNVEFVRSLGAETVIDYTTTCVADAAHAVDVVVDTVGGDVLAESYGLVRRGGILVTIAGQPDEAAAQERKITVTRPGMATAGGTILRQAAELFDTGRLKPYVREAVPLAEAARAHAEGESGHGRGHYVLKVG